MPGFTDSKQIPYPLPGEAPNGAQNMLDLATKVDDLFEAEEAARASAVAAEATARQNADTAEATARANGDTSLNSAIAAVKGAGWQAGQTIADLYTKVPTTKTVWGVSAVTTDNKGVGTITHNLGAVGGVKQVNLTCQIPDQADTDLRMVNVISDTLTGANTMKVIVYQLDATGRMVPFNGQPVIHWIVRD